MFNDEQRAYMAALDATPPEAKCWCGWHRLGECPHCPPDRTCADKLEACCSGCGNDSGPAGARPIVHRIGCPAEVEPEVER